jgi:hypothetical protein
MNVRSKYAEDENAIPKENKKYLPVGYGGPNTGGRAGASLDGRFGAASGLFDMIFEKLGIKKKSHKRSEDEKE